jgi:hypothetical protein
MATTRVISVDLVTGTPIDELEVRGLKYGPRLNGVGSVSGSVKLPSPRTAAGRIKGAIINDALDECRRVLIVERNGVIVGDGIVWKAPYVDAKQSRVLQSATSHWSYFRHRHIAARSVYAAVDQLTIARDLISDAQAVPGGNVGVIHNATTSGVLRDRIYESWELKNLGEAIEQLAGVQDGFDFGVDLHWDPATGNLVRTLTLSYPRRGRSYLHTGHVFELGRNMTSFEWPSDGSLTANKVWGVGAGEGKSMLLTAAVDASQIQPIASGGPGYPLLEDVLTNKDVLVRSTLEEQATARLFARSTPLVVPKITVRADMDPVLGSYIEGDAARVIIPPRKSPRFPDGLDTFYRILGWDVTVSDSGGESVELLLGEEPT